MRVARAAAVTITAVLVLAVLVLVGAPGMVAQASEPSAGSVPGAYEFTLTRVSNAHAVTVVWGDRTISRKTSRCSPARAAQRPKACTLRFTHVYRVKGDYTITVKWGSKVVNRWAFRAAFVPTGWRPYGDGATFAACSTVTWFYDATAQPAASAGMRTDVVAGLALLAQQTGLRFTEVSDRSRAQLTFGWADLVGSYGDVGGVGGRDGDGAYVRFSTTNWWLADQWPGFEVVTQLDGAWAIGRGWLVVHETMHALGFDHVADETSVMNPVISAHAFSPGDLAGLQTMYSPATCG